MPSTYLWVNNPRQFPDNYPKEGIGYDLTMGNIQGIPKLTRRLSRSPDDFSWQFDLYINSDRYPTQGIISVNQHNTESQIELTVIGRSDQLSLKQLEQAYDTVASILEGKMECGIPISVFVPLPPRKLKDKKQSKTESKTKGKKKQVDGLKSIEPVYLPDFD